MNENSLYNKRESVEYLILQNIEFIRNTILTFNLKRQKVKMGQWSKVNFVSMRNGTEKISLGGPFSKFRLHMDD